MPNWLAKAKAAFQPPEPQPPEPYRLVCVCGAVVNGVRTEHEQRVRCHECQHEMFVLPESAYPPPAVRYRRQVEVIDEDVEIVDEDDSPNDGPRGPADAISISKPKRSSPAAGKRKKRRWRRQEQSETETERSPTDADSAHEVEVDLSRGIRDRRRWRFKIFTPFRAIAVGILVAFLFTGYVVVHSRSVANAEAVRTTSGKLAQQALDQGDLATANQELTKVEKALTLLGMEDASSRQLHQLFLEVRAAANLMPTSVLEMISSAVDGSSATTITSWKDNFNLTYRGKWVVIDTSVNRDDSDSDVRIPVPMILDDESDERAEFVINRNWFAAGKPDGGAQRVIFGGRLDSCQATGTTDRTWEIRLAKGTFFFWTDPRTYEAVGFIVDEEAVQVLQQQSEALGVSK